VRRAAVLLLLLGGSAAQVSAAQDILLPRPATPAELSQRLQQAWSRRDAEGYLALWRFDHPQERASEARFVTARFAADELLLQPRGLRPGATGSGVLLLPAQLFTVNEPRARVEELVFDVVRHEGGWAIDAREERPGIDGLMHLSLDAQPYRAEGVRLSFEDFELDLQHGSLFTTPRALGPTVLVFVGRGVAHFHPRPEEEQEQLRQFSGRRVLDAPVTRAFVRLHPADYNRVVVPGELQPDPAGAGRLRDARKVFDEHVAESFVLDAEMPRSPWWLMPAVGEASVAFRSRLGTLTYTSSAGEPEGISLFDRPHRRQICLYPRQGRDTDYDEDDQRPVDVLQHDLRVRFDPQRSLMQAQDTLTLRMQSATPTLRLRLHEDFAVESVSSAEAGEHLFFRIRHQDGLLVSLGQLAGRIGEITLTVRYAGVHEPVPVEHEMQRVGDTVTRDEEIVLEPVIVYSNRTAWYPQSNADDYALVRLQFDLPPDYTALMGGRRLRAGVEGGRSVVEYLQDQPAKYITVAVGRLYEIGTRQVGGVELSAHAAGRTRRSAAEMLDLAAAVLPFFEQQFGPLPYRTLRLVAVEGITPGGHSPPGMVLVAERPPLMRGALRPDPAGFWDVPGFFFAHELAHQWWGHGVSGQNYRERWISESFAQYAAALWVRSRLGEDRFRDVMDRMRTWALRHTADGSMHLGYRLGHVRGNPQIYRAVVYDKGAYVLHMLAGVVGDEAFRTGLRALQEKFRFQKIGTNDVRRALEDASGRDLGAYFRQWVLGTALPSLQMAYSVRRVAGGEEAVVDVQARDLPGPVPLQVALTYGTGREEHVVELPPGGGRFTFSAPGRVRRVEINGDRRLLARVGGR
jgi:hypothetical protein